MSPGGRLLGLRGGASLAQDDSALCHTTVSSRAKTRDPGRSRLVMRNAFRTGPGGRLLGPGSSLRCARNDSALRLPHAVIPGEDPGSSAAVGRCEPRASVSPGGWTLGPGSALRLPGTTVRRVSPTVSSRAKTRDPGRRSAGGEKRLSNGPGRSAAGSRVCRFACPGRQSLCLSQCHPGRRPGIHGAVAGRPAWQPMDRSVCPGRRPSLQDRCKLLDALDLVAQPGVVLGRAVEGRAGLEEFVFAL